MILSIYTSYSMITNDEYDSGKEHQYLETVPRLCLVSYLYQNTIGRVIQVDTSSTYRKNYLNYNFSTYGNTHAWLTIFINSLVVSSIDHFQSEIFHCTSIDIFSRVNYFLRTVSKLMTICIFVFLPQGSLRRLKNMKTCLAAIKFWNVFTDRVTFVPFLIATETCVALMPWIPSICWLTIMAWAFFIPLLTNRTETRYFCFLSNDFYFFGRSWLGLDGRAARSSSLSMFGSVRVRIEIMPE